MSNTPPNMAKRRGPKFGITIKVESLLGSYQKLVSEIMTLGRQIEAELLAIQAQSKKKSKEITTALDKDAEYLFDRLKRYSKLLEQNKISRTQYIDQMQHIKQELSFVLVQLRDVSGEKVMYFTKAREEDSK